MGHSSHMGYYSNFSSVSLVGTSLPDFASVADDMVLSGD